MTWGKLQNGVTFMPTAEAAAGIQALLAELQQAQAQWSALGMSGRPSHQWLINHGYIRLAMQLQSWPYWVQAAPQAHPIVAWLIARLDVSATGGVPHLAAAELQELGTQLRALKRRDLGNVARDLTDLAFLLDTRHRAPDVAAALASVVQEVVLGIKRHA